jgi:CRISPR system Cascade subunit CasB
MPDEAPTTSERADARPLAQLVNRLAHAVSRQLSPGDLAALRRLSPDDLSAPAYWKLLGTVLVDEVRQGDAGLQRERRWGTILSAMAVTAGLHRPGRSLGAALAEAGYSELRLTRLFRAGGDALPPEVRSAASFLAAKAIPFDAADLAGLVLSDGGPSEDLVRRGIARSYYRQLTSHEQ